MKLHFKKILITAALSLVVTAFAHPSFAMEKLQSNGNNTSQIINTDQSDNINNIINNNTPTLLNNNQINNLINNDNNNTINTNQINNNKNNIIDNNIPTTLNNNITEQQTSVESNRSYNTPTPPSDDQNNNMMHVKSRTKTDDSENKERQTIVQNFEELATKSRKVGGYRFKSFESWKNLFADGWSNRELMEIYINRKEFFSSNAKGEDAYGKLRISSINLDFLDDMFMFCLQQFETDANNNTIEQNKTSHKLKYEILKFLDVWFHRAYGYADWVKENITLRILEKSFKIFKTFIENLFKKDKTKWLLYKDKEEIKKHLNSLISEVTDTFNKTKNQNNNTISTNEINKNNNDMILLTKITPINDLK